MKLKVDISTKLYNIEPMAIDSVDMNFPPTETVGGNPYLRVFEPNIPLSRKPDPDDPGRLTGVEEKIIEGVLEGLSPKEIAITTEYPSPKPVVAALETPRVRSALISALDSAGLTETVISQKIRAGLEATRCITDKLGNVTTEVPDHNAQHKYLTTLLEIRGDLSKKTEEHGDTWEEVLIQIHARRGK